MIPARRCAFDVSQLSRQVPRLLRFVATLLLWVSVSTGHAAENFAACPQFFANGKPPVPKQHSTDRALCYDSFAILHSAQSKTAVYVAEKLNRAVMAETPQKRSDHHFEVARLRGAERATLDDYKGSGYDRGHMAPAGDMRTAESMAQSFSLANMVPQAPEHNRGAWAKTVENPTRKYAF